MVICAEQSSPKKKEVDTIEHNISTTTMNKKEALFITLIIRFAGQTVNEDYRCIMQQYVIYYYMFGCGGRSVQ